ncbi:MAG TPA: hypothetical protein VL400_26630 [Polyangiaceae bacterium]|nr:hypothetical protein [Polyangiaceae bacterium]
MTTFKPDSKPTQPTDPGAASEPRSSGRDSVPEADLRQHTTGGATLWLTEEAHALSIWRGEVDAPDRLRVDARDGSMKELRLERSVGRTRPITLGRAAQVGSETNDLVYADVASRLATSFRFDGARWWIRRREECSVPVEVGAKSLGKSEEAPLVHGVNVVVGGMRAVFADRRYITFSVPAGAVDPSTGLLGRTGIELEVAIMLRRRGKGQLLVARDPASDEVGPLSQGPLSGPPATRPADGRDYPRLQRFALDLHAALPSAPIAVVDNVVLALLATDGDAIPADASRPSRDGLAVGLWPLRGSTDSVGREIELALSAVHRARPDAELTSLRDDASGVDISTADALLEAAKSDKRFLLFFGIEGQHALDRIGRHVLAGLEEELAAVVKAHAGPNAVVAPLARGVIGAAVPRKTEPAALGYAVQVDWHARPPVVDGRVELPRALSWELGQTQPGRTPIDRATHLSRECGDAHGVLSSLGGGLPYPIAGRVAALSTARSGVERVKMLFDVLEGTWRLLAVVVASAVFSSPGDLPRENATALGEFMRRNATRDGYPLGSWRELARLAAAALEGRTDPIATMAKDVLGVRLSESATFDQLSNLLQAERNSFAHGQYTEASAEQDLPEFEQMTRTLLRALRPLSVWTLVTVEDTEPDMYGEQQWVEYVDHTGPSPLGVRRRIGFVSSVRLANVTYLARFREGLVLPLEPFIRRLPTGDRFDLYFMDHLPRAGSCTMSGVVGGATQKSSCDARRLPPQLVKLGAK